MELWSVGETLEGQELQLPWLFSCPKGFRSPWCSWMLCCYTAGECLLLPSLSNLVAKGGVRKQGGHCRSSINTQMHLCYPMLLVSCQRPQLQTSFWEGKETFPKGIGPHVDTCCPVSVLLGTSCGPHVDDWWRSLMRHILALLSVIIPSLLTHTGWQDGKGCSAYGCICARKHVNCLPGTKNPSTSHCCAFAVAVLSQDEEICRGPASLV